MSKDLTEAQLNDITQCDFSNEESFQKWMDADPALESSWCFRRDCIKAGFYLKELYPVYHQGWELDEWGAIGTKDGKEYCLETNHGSLVPELIPSTGQQLKSFVRDLFRSIID